MKTAQELLKIAAGQFLSSALPDDWRDLDIYTQYQFINKNAWEPFEGMAASEIYEEIENLSYILHKLEGDAYGEGHADGYKEALQDAEEEQAGGSEPISIYDHLSNAFCDAIKK